MGWIGHISWTAPDLVRGRFGARCSGAGVGTVVVAAVLCGSVGATEIAVPSGQPLTLHQQVVVEPERRILYLGFLAPLLGGDYPITYDRASTDMDALCTAQGLDLAVAAGDVDTQIEEVVVRLMERVIGYGEVDPDVAQFVNAYDITSGACEWY